MEEKAEHVAEEEEEERFAGFTDEESARLYPIVESTSRKLFLMVQDLRNKFAHKFGDALRKCEEPVVVPKDKLDQAGGSDIILERIRYQGDNVAEVEEENNFVTMEDVMKTARMKADGEGKDEHDVEAGTEAPGISSDIPSTSGSSLSTMQSVFSPAELELLRKPMGEGWTRDVVLKSVDGSGAGEVSYISPSGFTVRSYKDLIVQLSKNPLSELSRQNFSFTARPVGGTINEFVKYPVESSKAMEKRDGSELDSNAKNVTFRRRTLFHLKDLGDRKTQKIGAQTKGNGPIPTKRVGSMENNVQPEKRYKSDSSKGYVMGTLPPNFPKACLTNSAEDAINDVEVPRRRGRPVTKKDKDRPVENAESDEGMFQISALTKIFAGMEQSELDDYNHMANLMAAQQSMLDQLDPSGSFTEQVEQQRESRSEGYNVDNVLGDGEVQPRDEILPCSIRCAGMTGEIPTLQCKRCLCLYHPECLGFPPNLNAANFLCSNCDEISTKSSTASPDRPQKKEPTVLDFMEKMMELRKPPVLQPSASFSRLGNKSLRNRPGRGTGFQPIGKGGMSVKRLDGSGRLPASSSEGAYLMAPGLGRGHGMSIAPVNMKRGRGGGVRGRGGKIPIPQLSRNLTITPISIPIKGQAPKVPNLNPINGSARNSAPPVPMFNTSGLRGRGRPRGGRANLPALLPAMLSLGEPGGSSSSATSEENKPYRPRYPFPNFGASFGTVRPPPPNLFRRFPQSVITVGLKKFIAIPNVWHPQIGRSSVIAQRESGPFGRNSDVIKQVFAYLTSKDLLQAALVSKKWNQEAKKQWRIVRLKNTRIYDVELFIDFIAPRSPEMIDFRKMLGSIDWATLFSLLNKVSSLQSVILGPRSQEIMALFREQCPGIRLMNN